MATSAPIPDEKSIPHNNAAEPTSSTGSLRSEDLVIGDYGSDSNHAFTDPKVADYWRGVYKKAQYECRHRFDPDITWSAAEELKLRRKVSTVILCHEGING